MADIVLGYLLVFTGLILLGLASTVPFLGWLSAIAGAAFIAAGIVLIMLAEQARRDELRNLYDAEQRLSEAQTAFIEAAQQVRENCCPEHWGDLSLPC